MTDQHETVETTTMDVFWTPDVKPIPFESKPDMIDDSSVIYRGPFPDQCGEQFWKFRERMIE